MHQAILHLGSNQGHRIANLAKAVWLIESFATLTDLSDVYRTAAWGLEDQADFANQAMIIRTALPVQELLKRIQVIEHQMGRKRAIKWGARTIDIDILDFDQQVFQSEALQLPHPRLHLRNFVLVPLNEIAAEWVHPIFEKTTSELLHECPDSLPVKRWEEES